MKVGHIILASCGLLVLTSDVTAGELSCSGVYATMTGHTLCLEDSPNVVADKSFVSAEDETAITEFHNHLRGYENLNAEDLVNLKWDSGLASVAQKWAKQCKLGHDDNKNRAIPELGMSIGQNAAAGQTSWTSAIQSWFDEITLFKYGQDPEVYIGPGGWKKIGHFTQIVQNGTYLVGCGYAECVNSNYTRYYVCNYAAGQSNFKTPYTNGTRCGACKTCVDGLCDCNGRVCVNGGTLDVSTCICSCKKLYVGDQCETLNCPSQDESHCAGSYNQTDCTTYTNVPEECPIMCGICEDPCPGKTCLHGGTLGTESDICGCQCPDKYEGDRCQYLKGCPAEDPSHCVTQWPKSYCDEYPTFVPERCPHMCDLCKP